VILILITLISHLHYASMTQLFRFHLDESGNIIVYAHNNNILNSEDIVP
jgi:hypothetical protein